MSTLSIYSPVVNHTEFIELQYLTIKRFVHVPFEYTVFNDAKDWTDYSNFGNKDTRKKISEFCNKMNINCINIPNEHHRHRSDAAERCADSYNFILKQYHFQQPILALDSDMFLVSDFPHEKYSQYKACFVKQERSDLIYVWNGIYYMNQPPRHDLMDWTCKYGGDVGSGFKEWMQLYEHDPSVYLIQHLRCEHWTSKDLPCTVNPKLLDTLRKDPRNKVTGEFFCELYDEFALHYRAGGNWEGLTLHKHHERFQILKKGILELIKS